MSIKLYIYLKINNIPPKFPSVCHAIQKNHHQINRKRQLDTKTFNVNHMKKRDRK